MSLWRSRSSLAVGTAICLLLVLFSSSWLYGDDFREAPQPFTPTSISDAGSKSWSWNPDRDRNIHHLSDAQCSAAFPRLYKEIDRASNFWTARQGKVKVKEENIDLEWSWDGGLRCMIYDQSLYIIYSRGQNHYKHWSERHRATLEAIHRAILTSPEPVPNIEFSIKISDDVLLTEENPDVTFWAFSRNTQNRVHDQLWVIPDFNFWAYPRTVGSFADYQRQALQAGSDFDNKTPKLVWRGTLEFNADVRGALLEQSKDKPWSDVASVREGGDANLRISMEDHCRYKFAAHTEGSTWSGRLKYLLSCGSVVFIHPLKYHTHLYHLLNPEGPEQNYVPVEPNWSDLPAKIDGLLNDPQKAKAIAGNAADMFRDRYATPAAQSCYFRRLFHEWSKVAFEPKPHETVKLKDGKEIKKIRGMTYEEYIIKHGTFDIL